MLDRGTELDAFKRDICLIEFALSRGYTLDARNSSRSSVVLTDPSGDKVIVAKAQDGHWIYFSVRDDQDNGTIIDFLQRRSKLSLGEVRTELRRWLSLPASPALPPSTTPRFWHDIKASSKSLLRVRALIDGMTTAVAHPYLEMERAIPASVLASSRFSECVRIDGRCNAIFPHRNQDGISGWEAKNRGFTGFAPGGEKGLWTSASFPSDSALVITESAIDALSYAVLNESPTTRYASIAGSMNHGQPELLRLAAYDLPVGARLVIATDNDDAGDRLLDAIREALRPVQREMIEDRPKVRGLDWNDVLRSRRSHHLSQDEPTC